MPWNIDPQHVNSFFVKWNNILATFYNLNLAADLLEEEIKKTREENKILEDRRDELKGQLSG